MQRLASIDIGSQTIRLLVADIGPDKKLLPVTKDRAIIRLGQGVQDSGRLSPDAISRAIICIADFARTARDLGAASIYAEATACVRQAANRDVFLQAVKTATGILPRVLTGREEALTSLAGVRSVIGSAARSALIVDIGGGSTELVLTEEDRIVQAASIPLGVIGLTEDFLIQDPPGTKEKELMHGRIRAALAPTGLALPPFTQAETLVGTAGTVTTLAAMDMKMACYDEQRINGYTLTGQAVEKLYKAMLGHAAAQRASMPGLEPGRAAVIPAGAAIVVEVLSATGLAELRVSDAGLLEGILLTKL